LLWYSVHRAIITCFGGARAAVWLCTRGNGGDVGDNRTDRFSASEQGLGYLYQPRFALLHLLQLPEATSVFVEKDDDLDFADRDGKKTLVSLKHKAVGERLTNLSMDFWKSVRIRLTRYVENGRIESTHRFYLFTTNEVSETSLSQSGRVETLAF